MVKNPEQPRGARKARSLCIGLGLIVPAAVAATVLAQHYLGTSNAAPEAPVPVIASRSTEAAEEMTVDDLEHLSWQDLARAVRQFGAAPEVIPSITDPDQPLQQAPLNYLRGLFLMVQNRPEAALLAFGEIKVEEIPALHLYAPYRLHGALQSDQANPYLRPLEDAIHANRLPILIQARVEATEGRLEEALLSYARSNPDQWARQDLTMLENIRRHAGLSPDVDLLIRGALRGGGIQSDLRPQLIALTKGQLRGPEAEALKIAEFKNRLSNDPELRRIASKAALRHLSIRKQFMEKDYLQLLGDHRRTDPKTVTDETALLLLLSAARLTDIESLDRWSLEIKRRNPSNDVAEWVQSLRPASL